MDVQKEAKQKDYTMFGKVCWQDATTKTTPALKDMAEEVYGFVKNGKIRIQYLENGLLKTVMTKTLLLENAL